MKNTDKVDISQEQINQTFQKYQSEAQEIVKDKPFYLFCGMRVKPCPYMRDRAHEPRFRTKRLERSKSSYLA